MDTMTRTKAWHLFTISAANSLDDNLLSWRINQVNILLTFFPLNVTNKLLFYSIVTLCTIRDTVWFHYVFVAIQNLIALMIKLDIYVDAKFLKNNKKKMDIHGQRFHCFGFQYLMASSQLSLLYKLLWRYDTLLIATNTF